MGKKKKTIYVIGLTFFIVTIVILIIYLSKIFIYPKGKDKKIREISNALFNQEVKKEIGDYIENRKKINYKNDGEIKFEFKANKESELPVETVNLKLKINGMQDNENKRTKQNFILDYGNDVEFPLEYKKIKDEIGFKTKYIGSKSIVFSDLEQGFKKSYDNKEDINKILNSMFKEIKEEDIVKIKEEYKGYRINLTKKDIYYSLKNALESLKEEVKVNPETNEDENKIRKIDEILARIEFGIEYSDLENEKIEITVFVDKKQFKSIKIKSKEMNFSIAFNKNENNVEAQVIIEQLDENQKFEIKIGIKDITERKKLNEYVELIIKDKYGEYKYNYINNLEVEENIQIEEFNKENSLKFNELSKEKQNKLAENILKRLEKVNESHMKKLGVKDARENPLIYISPATLDLTIENAKINERAKKEKEKAKIEEIKENFKMEIMVVDIEEASGDITKEEKLDKFIEKIKEEYDVKNIEKIDEETVSFEYKNREVIVNIEKKKITVK